MPVSGAGGTLTWLQIALTTTEPSPTLEATRLTDPERTSPTAKMPGQDVAKPVAAPTSAPVLTKPARSSSTRPDSQPVLGAAPIMMNSARQPTVQLPSGPLTVTSSR